MPGNSSRPWARHDWTVVTPSCLSCLTPTRLTDCSLYWTLHTHHITSTSAQQRLWHLTADIQRTPPLPHPPPLLPPDFVLPSTPPVLALYHVWWSCPLCSPASIIHYLHPFVLLALWTLSTHPSGPICSHTSSQGCPQTSLFAHRGVARHNLVQFPLNFLPEHETFKCEVTNMSWCFRIMLHFRFFYINVTC